MHMCHIPNGFRDTVISLCSSKIVDKKEILRTVYNTAIYFSSDKVGTVYLVQHIFENSTVNINALCNSCEDMASVQCTVYCTVNSSISETVRNRTHVYIYCTSLLMVRGVSERSGFDAADRQKRVQHERSLNFDTVIVKTIVFFLLISYCSLKWNRV
jgi:hypothetical protein